MTDDSKTPRRQVLEEAADLIDGDRNKTYGSPTQNFTNIAELWNTRFAHLLKDGAEFDAADVADAMILLKVARNIADKKRDNFVDIAGYAGCGYEATLSEDKPEQKKFAQGGFITDEPGPITINVHGSSRESPQVAFGATSFGGHTAADVADTVKEQLERVERRRGDGYRTI